MDEFFPPFEENINRAACELDFNEIFIVPLKRFLDSLA